MECFIYSYKNVYKDTEIQRQLCLCLGCWGEFKEKKSRGCVLKVREKKGSVKLVEIVINEEPHGSVSKPGQGIERRIGFRSHGLTGCGGHTDIVLCDLRAANIWSHGATKTNSR